MSIREMKVILCYIKDHVMNPRLTNILSHANTINLPIKFVHKVLTIGHTEKN